MLQPRALGFLNCVDPSVSMSNLYIKFNFRWRFVVHDCIDGYSRRIISTAAAIIVQTQCCRSSLMPFISWVCLVECVLIEVGRMWMLHHTCCSIHLEGQEGEVSSPDAVFIIKESKGCGVICSQAAPCYSTIFSISWKTTLRLFLMWTMKCTCFVCIMCLCSESTMLYRCLLMPEIITLCHLCGTSHPFNYGLLVCPDRVWSKT